MIKVTSVSGGRTSAYLAANYPADFLLFALVRIEDENCRFPDEMVRREVEDRIQAPFIATAEDDMIIYTMLDLEQYLGRKINWVTGITYDEVVRSKGGWLPNKLHRYCTFWMKIDPMFYWWDKNISEPVEMNIGYRANEVSRADTMLSKVNKEGFIEFEATFKKHAAGRNKGQNKWESIAWQKPLFPLINDNIYKDSVVRFWEDKPVRFAERNNCVGCFHRSPLLLKLMFDTHPNKMEWFKRQEGGKNGYWRSDMSYETIEKHRAQFELSFESFSECDSGYCEV